MDKLNIIFLVRTNSPFEKDALASLEQIKIPFRFFRQEERKHRWADAVNNALDRIESGPVLIMEEDIVIAPGQAIVEDIMKDESIIGSGLLLTGKDYIGHGGGIIDPKDSNIHLIAGSLSSLLTNYPREVDVLSGSFLFVPERAWKTIRPVRMPGLGWEDISWILNLRSKGFRAVVYPLILYHFCTPIRAVSQDVRNQIDANFQIIQRSISQNQKFKEEGKS